ncbi:uncharacterized protein isoform X2 [Rhodnius prolixus]|uniref:uncharacterized protein isoform X2 n=1 Tax=Rhodnius prolixus TaxID=13249 RepID=UPI003D18F800
MTTFLAVLLFTSFVTISTFIFRFLTFKYAIDGGPYDDGNDFTKCYDVTPMSDFNSNKFFEKPKHMYVTHSRYGGRFGICREFYTNKYTNGTIGYNYEFNGNGKPEEGIKAYTSNCTGTEGSEQKGQFSFFCYQKLDWDFDLGDFKFEGYEEGMYADYGNDEGVNEEAKEVAEEKVVEEVTETAEGNAKEYDLKFPLKVTVLSTDYNTYALIHMCAEITHEDKTTSFIIF